MAEKLKDGALSLIVLDGAYERVHYALSMAAAAAAIGRKTILFFTNHALWALAAPREGGAGWHRLLADGQGRNAASQDQARRDMKVAGFDELLAACAEMGVRLIACDMGLRTARLTADDLRSDLAIDIAGLVTLYADTPGEGQIVVV